jgi:uncharacterized protein YecA (UPF0149 family)
MSKIQSLLAMAQMYESLMPVRPVRPIKRDEPKINRNEPCPCGSGKKYKKCCLINLNDNSEP